jgi:hypothetical protein
MDRLANQWLLQAHNYTYDVSKPVKEPLLWYKFNESGTTTNPADSGTGDANDYAGTIVNFVSQNWDPNGGRDGNNCLYLPSGGRTDAPGASWVDMPGKVLNYLSEAGPTTGTTFSVWIKADVYAAEFYNPGQWNSLISIVISPDGATRNASNGKFELECPTPTNAGVASCDWHKKNIPGLPDGTAATGYIDLGSFGFKWNHWAFVKEPLSMKTYLNGQLVAHLDANGLPGDPNGAASGPLVIPPPSGVWVNGNMDGFVLGLRGDNSWFNWGNWVGRMDDFKVYDYALSQAEVEWLATDSQCTSCTASVFVPLLASGNLNTDGSASPLTDVNQIVNFGDIAIMEKQWHTQILWP